MMETQPWKGYGSSYTVLIFLESNEVKRMKNFYIVAKQDSCTPLLCVEELSPGDLFAPLCWRCHSPFRPTDVKKESKSQKESLWRFGAVVLHAPKRESVMEETKSTRRATWQSTPTHQSSSDRPQVNTRTFREKKTQ